MKSRNYERVEKVLLTFYLCHFLPMPVLVSICLLNVYTKNLQHILFTRNVLNSYRMKERLTKVYEK